MNNKKLIVCDIDGTLLPEGHKLSNRTIECIKELSSSGHMVVLATGRPLRIVLDFYNLLNLNTPIICYNGALLIHPKEENFPVYSRKFDKNILRKISINSQNIIHNSFCENLNNMFVEDFNKKIDFYFDYKDQKCITGKIKDTLCEDVYNCCLYYDSDHLDELESVVKTNSPYEIRLWNTPGYCELYNPGADKGTCVKRIMEIYNFRKEDVIAFGDGENDRTMLETAGLGYCMKNSKSPSLKRDFLNTTFTSLDNGVVRTIEYLNLFFK